MFLVFVLNSPAIDTGQSGFGQDSDSLLQHANATFTVTASCVEQDKISSRPVIGCIERPRIKDPKNEKASIQMVG